MGEGAWGEHRVAGSNGLFPANLVAQWQSTLTKTQGLTPEPATRKAGAHSSQCPAVAKGVNALERCQAEVIPGRGRQPAPQFMPI